MKKIKIIHLASFNGNIGDNINHIGFRNWFEKIIDYELSWTEIEIREFFWKKRYWNRELVNLFNSHDLIIIGGGNFFELWVDSSPTGTSIAFPLNIFKMINKPIYFNALGVDIGQGYTSNNKKKFKNFLDIILNNDQFLLSVRNDGAKKNLKILYGDEFLKKIYDCPDHGFFIQKPSKLKESNKTEFRLAINLACDMPNIRFKNFGQKKIEKFSINFCKFLIKLYNEVNNLKIIFIPHIYLDLHIYNLILKNLPDYIRRNSIKISSYGAGNEHAIELLDHYYQSDFIIGMRFHANVIPIALNKKFIALNNYPQIFNLFEELNQIDKIINISKPNFENQLFQRFINLYNKKSFASVNLPLEDVKKSRNIFGKTLKKWINKKVDFKV